MNIGLTEDWLKGMHEDEYGFVNPAFDFSMIQQFDVARGYQLHHLKCIQQAPRISQAPLDDLGRQGFDVRSILEPKFADGLADRVKAAGRNVYPGDMEKAEVEGILNAIFSPSVHAMVNRYFLTEFAVIFFGLLHTKPLTEQEDPNTPSVSFGWHCDGGPMKHLKMLIYLNSNNEHDGATDYLDSSATALFKKVGYVFCPIHLRLQDLSGLAAQHRVPYDPQRLRPDRGEGITFEPAGVLHKGVYPTRGVRCVLQVGLIPWPVSWQQFFAQNYELLVNNTGSGFPKLN